MESRSGQGLRFVKRMIQQEIEIASISASASFSTLCSDYCRIPWWIPSKWSYLDWLYPKSISSCVVHSLLKDIVSKVFQESFMDRLSTSKSYIIPNFMSPIFFCHSEVATSGKWLCLKLPVLAILQCFVGLHEPQRSWCRTTFIKQFVCCFRRPHLYLNLSSKVPTF